jgi:hypothetical protein
MRPRLTHCEEVPRKGQLFITIAMPLDPAFGFAMVVSFLDGGCFQTFNIIYSYVINLLGTTNMLE